MSIHTQTSVYITEPIKNPLICRRCLLAYPNEEGNNFCGRCALKLSSLAKFVACPLDGERE